MPPRHPPHDAGAARAPGQGVGGLHTQGHRVGSEAALAEQAVALQTGRMVEKEGFQPPSRAASANVPRDAGARAARAAGQGLQGNHFEHDAALRGGPDEARGRCQFLFTVSSKRSALRLVPEQF